MPPISTELQISSIRLKHYRPGWNCHIPREVHHQHATGALWGQPLPIHPWFQSLELFQGRLPYFHQWHKDAGAESHTKIQNYRWRYVSIYVKSVKSLIKLLPFHRYCRHWKVITIYYSFREDGLANNQTEREHGDVQVKVAIPGNILYNKQKPLIL